ncbi:MAG: hypothetical protein JOZ81_02540 [Chloroflexi bacterium]|nr:hypothetical protein [Chloroflexota bacterium]MBV9543199.1 hypothetical protein [Chloroflexota bacterium]
MGAAFWITQLVLMVTAIAIAVSVERRNRAERNNPPPDAPYHRIPVESARVRRRSSGSTSFTAAEQSRLAMLRRVVEQARALKTDLYDDLQPDRSQDDIAAPFSFTHVRSWTTLAVGAGALLVIMGVVGVWQANAAITRLEQMPTGTLVPGSLSSHLLPGAVANPGKYLAAVNSSSNTTGNRDPIQVMTWLQQKETVDRFEALIGLGVAFILIAIAGWPRPAARTPGFVEDDEPRGSIGSDLLPFVLVVSVFLVAMSFFELP